MHSIAIMSQQRSKDHEERSRALNDAAKRLLQRLLGCWQHDLGRPFTHKGKTYRVCVKCGLARDFNLTTWKTQGGSYALPVAEHNRHLTAQLTKKTGRYSGVLMIKDLAV